MYGLMYSAVFDQVAVSALQDLFELLAPSDAAVVIHEIKVANTDLADSDQHAIQVQRVTGAPTSGSGGSTPTPRPLLQGAPAAGSTVEVNNTTQLSGGTAVQLDADAFNNLAPYHWLPTPESRIVLSPSTRLVVELPVAPAAAIALSGRIVFEEIGG